MNEQYEVETQNQRLVCIRCDQPYVFTVGEQVFYSARNLAPPRRCPACRGLRRAEMATVRPGEQRDLTAERLGMRR